MAFSKENRKGTISGIIFVAIFAAAATMIADIAAVKALGISPLVIGIVLGIFYANTLHNHVPSAWGTGITFSGKKILRFAIVFYGFRITFQEIMDVGMSGFMVSLIMLATTFILGSYLGYKIFKMDKETSMLTASGASVCGAAAVLATEPVLKAEGHKTAVAVSMVVLFGTISMFLYPVLYAAVIEPATGFLHMTPQEFGIYVGGTIHEVAQVVAVPASIQGTPTDMANSAVIVKMTRVIMIAPMLILLGIYLSMEAKKSGSAAGGVKLVIPWFAVYFIGMAGFNSLQLVPADVVSVINEIDTFLLTMAMTALGMGTIFSKFKGLGLAPLYTAGAMFLWLVIGGFIVTKLVVATFS
ncbi:YeiH family protein [Sulfurimonas marina]|uniref:YeiH family putative sulfate export transporter n=1 Tax=Sulfurimonas marina TaxID=2590551 RepID=A0A7M1AXR3_9BACT|nr:YeiH family protein [Sulfurimonas marina]QOP42251.1 YeiH family putative sulfate export transporter [Sulfurimonas marina]